MYILPWRERTKMLQGKPFAIAQNFSGVKTLYKALCRLAWPQASKAAKQDIFSE